MSVVQLWLPILLSSVAIFFGSFLSWMVLQLHKKDWQRLPQQEELMSALRRINAPLGNFMFPSCDTPQERESEEFQKLWKGGPRGVLTLFPEVNMGQNLGLTMLLFLVVNFTLGYLGSMAFKPGTDFLTIFRFFATASLLMYLTGVLQHSIWFRCRVVGHVVESVAYALIAGLIFASLWPAA